jgi:hypothetical protein
MKPLTVSPKEREKTEPPFLALRYRREPARSIDGPVQPFTEVPDEILSVLQRAPSPLRLVINGILLSVLGLALLALVAAFSYQLINQPHVLAQWGAQTLNAMRLVLQAAAGLLP